MTTWISTIELNPLINSLSLKYDLDREEEPAPEEVRIALSKEVSKSIFLIDFSIPLLEAKSIAELNRILNQVYDEADRRKIWCGL